MSTQAEPRNLERELIRQVLARHPSGSDPRALAMAVQEALDYLPKMAIEEIARHAAASADHVRLAVEQDDTLRLAPRGRYRVTICTGETCARRGGASLVRLARETLGVELFRASANEAIRIEPFRCFGQCAMAPNIRIDGATRGAMTESRFRLLLQVLGRSSS